MSDLAPEVISKIEKYASEDAKADGTDSAFQAFYARLIQLAGIATAEAKEEVAGAVDEFREWAMETTKKLFGMAGDIPGNVGFPVDALRLPPAQLVEKRRHWEYWERRFGPELRSKIDKGTGKNSWWLVKKVLLLMIIESVPVYVDNSNDMIKFLHVLQPKPWDASSTVIVYAEISLATIWIPMGLFFVYHLMFYRLFYRHDIRPVVKSLVFAVGLLIVAGILMTVLLFLMWPTCSFSNGCETGWIQDIITNMTGFTKDDWLTSSGVLIVGGMAFIVLSSSNMWRFLDPYRKARKCRDDLVVAEEEFMRDSRKKLLAARDKFRDTSCEIERMVTKFSDKMQSWKKQDTLVHRTAINKANQIFTHYRQQYATMKGGPSLSLPALPVVTPENAEGYGVGITEAQRDNFADMKKLLTYQISKAEKKWAPELRDITKKIEEEMT